MFNDALARPVPEMSPQPELRKHIEVDRALRWLPELMDTLEQRGPAKLAAEAQRMRSLSAEEQSALLTGYLRDGLDTTAAASFIARLLFQPYAEFMAMQVPAVPTTSATVCPICGGKPQFAVLRPEGDGGKRHLTCSFCSTEWEFRRVLCPVCAEMDYSKLPRYLPEEPIAVRVEACDSCKFYLKSFDMTVDGLLVPEIDEVATIALDVWAGEHGYQKIQPNVMGF